MSEYRYTAVSWPQKASDLIAGAGLPVRSGKASEGLLWIAYGVPVIASTKVDPAGLMDTLRPIRDGRPGFAIVPRRGHPPERAYWITEATVGVEMIKRLGFGV